MNELLKLFISFAKVGALTFGGGYAMLPILQREIVEKNKWATEEELMNYFAIGQCTPGMIAVNTATFIGCKKKGIIGGTFATLGVITPSMIIITFVAMFLSSIKDNIYIQYAFEGIRACVTVLILDTVINLIRKSLKDNFGLLIFLIVLLLSLFTSLSPAILIILSGISGYIVRKFKTERNIK